MSVVMPLKAIPARVPVTPLPRAMPASFFKSRTELGGVREDEFTALCTSHPAVRHWTGDALAHVFRRVPDLAGIYATQRLRT